MRITSEQMETLGVSNLILKDSTLNSRYGHFLWASSEYDSSNKNLSKIASIFSETIINYNNSCFSFMYILGDQSSQINIFRKSAKFKKRGISL